jgi:TRAP-type transport system periplasmic protein
MTTKAPIAYAYLAVFAALLIGGIYFASSRTAAGSESLTINWLITHRPVELFDEPGQIFAREFESRTGMPLKVSITGPDDYAAETRRILGSEALDMMDRGEAQIVTLNVKSLVQYAPEVAVLMRPYLFASYEEAERIYEGAVGQQILDAITANTNAKALAFTYSGGFMIMQSNTQHFDTPASVAGKKVATINGDISGENITALGAQAVVLPIGDYSNKELNQLVDDYDGIETTYTRLTGATPRYITETNHGLLITAIVVDKDFFASLSAENQAALSEAAQIAARAERQASRALAEKNKQALIEGGTVVRSINAETRAAFVQKAASVYTAHPEEKDLVDRIRESR